MNKFYYNPFVIVSNFNHTLLIYSFQSILRNFFDVSQLRLLRIFHADLYRNKLDNVMCSCQGKMTL